MKCPVCRSRVGRHDTFCGACGTPFVASPPPRVIGAPPVPPVPPVPNSAAYPLPPVPPSSAGFGAPVPPAPPAPVGAPLLGNDQAHGVVSWGGSEYPPAPPAPPAPPGPAHDAGTPADENLRAAGPALCTYCGAVLSPGDIFCGSCGNVNAAAVAPPEAFPPAPPALPEPAWADASAAGAGAAHPEPPVGETSSYSTDSFAPPVAADAPAPVIDLPAPATPVAADSVPEVADDGDETVVVRRTVPVVSFDIEFSTGQTETVSGPTIFGRNPKAPASDAGSVTRVVIQDVTRSVSKTHGEFSIVDGALYYRDLGSANGSELVTSGESQLLEPQQWVELTAGSEVVIGDQRFTVL